MKQKEELTQSSTEEAQRVTEAYFLFFSVELCVFSGFPLCKFFIFYNFTRKCKFL